MASSSVSESPDKSIPTTDLHEEDGEDIKEELQDLIICQSPYTYIPDNLCPHNQAESNMPNMTKRLSMAWDLLKDIPGSIFTSFIQDLYKNRPQEEIRNIIVKLNSLVSDERCEAPDIEQKERPTNKIASKINSTTKGHTAKKPGPNKGKRELNAITKDLEYWSKISHSFNSDTNNQKRRSSIHSSISNVQVLDEDEATSEEDVPTVVAANKNLASLCKITAVESLSGKKDSNVESLQSLQKSPLGQDRSFPSFQKQYFRLLHECAGVLNSQDEKDQGKIPSSTSAKRKLPKTETQIVGKRGYVESAASSPICVLNRLESKISQLKTQLSDKKSYYPKDTTLKCKFCPKSDYILKSASGLENHLLRHYKLRPMQCTRCKMTLHNDDGILRKHEKMIHGGRKCFFTKTELPSGPPVRMDIPIPNRKRRKMKRFYDFK